MGCGDVTHGLWWVSLMGCGSGMSRKNGSLAPSFVSVCFLTTDEMLPPVPATVPPHHDGPLHILKICAVISPCLLKMLFWVLLLWHREK